jgi:hypothetical protein
MAGQRIGIPYQRPDELARPSGTIAAPTIFPRLHRPNENTIQIVLPPANGRRTALASAVR